MTDDVYRVPLTGHGVVYVKSDSPDEAVREAKVHASTDDLELVFDVNHAETYSVELVPVHCGTLANAEGRD